MGNLITSYQLSKKNNITINNEKQTRYVNCMYCNKLFKEDKIKSHELICKNSNIAQPINAIL